MTAEKYQRFGYMSQDRKSDGLVKLLEDSLPSGDALPTHWHYRSHDRFSERYGHLGTVLWAKSANSHLLLISCWPILRVWTDVSKSCWVDLSPTLASVLATKQWASVVAVPVGNSKKSKPFTQRIKVWQQFHIQNIADEITRIYGLHSTTV